MRKFVVTGISLVVFLGLAGAGGWWWFIQKPKAEAEANALAEVEEVKRRVLDRLNDPGSAQFRDVKLHTKTGAGCGEVNAKNRMGGYVGFTLFVAFKDGDVRFEPTENLSSNDASARVEALQKQLNFLTLLQTNCPETGGKR